MKKYIRLIVATLFGVLPSLAFAQIPQYTNTAQAGVSLFTGVPATATSVTGQVRLPSFTGTGVLTITESGITGSPSGCTVTLSYQGNNAATVGAVVSTTSFTPSTGTQVFTITPTNPVGDSYVATYACSSTYPTAGSITTSFSPVSTMSADPCFNSPKSTVSIAISTATTTSLVAAAAGKSVYVCGFTASVGATTTLQFETGTGAACVTTQVALTGVIAPSTGAVLSLSGEGTKLTAPAGQPLCGVSTGTGGINGVLTYTQQ